MRVLFCNKYNYRFSGTESYIFDAMELLRSRGHDAELFSMEHAHGIPTAYDRYLVPHIDFRESQRWCRKLPLAARAVYSWKARRQIRAMISEFRPDIAHVRNIYHHLTPSILWELKAHNIPIIYHLNDFKLLCPAYNLVSQGEACESCKNGKFRNIIRENCYPEWQARLALASEAYVHKWLGSYRKCIDCFLAPSEFVRRKFVEHGWEQDSFRVLPHFQRVEPLQSSREPNPPVLYFGRLSPEKGINDLLGALQRLPHLRAVIAGEGPERSQLEKFAAELRLSNVSFVGALAPSELRRTISESQFSVLPTHAYETFGKTILESYASGRTVIATDLGSRRELIEHGVTGLLYPTGNVSELAKAIEFLSSRPKMAEQMGLAGRALVQQNYTPDSHYNALLDLYEHVRDGKRSVSNNSAPAVPNRTTPNKTARFSPAAEFIPVHQLTSAPRHEKKNVTTPSPKPQLRIAFIGARGLVSKYSGIETYYEEVGSRLSALGIQVTAYCRPYFTPALDRYKGMHIVRLPTIRSKHLETLLHTAVSTFHALTGPYDVVHYHALGPALFSFIPRLIGKRTVVTVQGLDWQRKKWGSLASATLRFGELAAAIFPNRTIVVSRTLQTYYRKRYQIQPSYIPNGGLLRTWREPREISQWGLETGKYILFLGRLSPEKNCHLLIAAYEQLNTDVKLVLAGASSYASEYTRQIREHGSDRIRIYDWVSGGTLDELLTNAMIFVLPSDLEGLSLALLDAMGAGLCVLTSDVPENREAIHDAGYTFRSGDVRDLADRLRFLISNPAVREAAGKAARQRVRNEYRWSTIAADTEQVYLDALGWNSSLSPHRKPSRSVPSSGTEKIAG